MKSGTHTFLRTERVHFGAGSLEKIEEEARPKCRTFVITGRSLHEGTRRIRRVQELVGERHAGIYTAMGQNTPGSAVEEAAGEAESAAPDLLAGHRRGRAILRAAY